MTSEEIKTNRPTDLSTNGWLREICVQLALLNEKATVPPPEVEQIAVQLPITQKRAYTRRTPK